MMNYSRAVCLLGMAVVLVTGCASKQSVREGGRPGDGIAEYRQITDLSSQAIQKALSSLEVVAAHSNHCSPELLAAFSEDVQRLQVDSTQVRARSQALLAQGANELAELGAGIDILQEAFGNCQADVEAGRSAQTALTDMCQVLGQAARVWLQQVSRVSAQLRVGGAG